KLAFQKVINRVLAGTVDNERWREFDKIKLHYETRPRQPADLTVFANVLAAAAKANDWKLVTAIVRWRDRRQKRRIKPDMLATFLTDHWKHLRNRSDEEICEVAKRAGIKRSVIAIRDCRLKLGLSKFARPQV